ncbi:MAG: exosortase-associated EpsI family protein [Chloroflexi bacterium]|nr:exosortase-associated EpsI family protein [Chloroflexota bacterium]
MNENEPSSNDAPTESGLQLKSVIPVTAILSALVLGCWAFPRFWYTQTDAQEAYFWLSEQTEIKGWNYQEFPVAKSAEATLVADRLVNGEFTNPAGSIVRVFSAKRYQEKQNEIGLFVHTPDRCWTEAGWKLEPAVPDLVEVALHGITLRFERRIFATGNQRELVYFCGLTGGQPLPYRLDHNLSIGLKYQLRTAKDKSGATLRASDQQLWNRVWESFVSRRPLLGPKQFLRVSTPIQGEDSSAADQLLKEFLPSWLASVDYQKELEAWQRRGDTRR